MFETTKNKHVAYRRGGHVFKGTVKDDVWKEEKSDNGREFVDLIQYIKFDNGVFGIRICYYVRNNKREKWKFANRPLSITSEALEELLIKARKKDWFPKT